MHKFGPQLPREVVLVLHLMEFGNHKQLAIQQTNMDKSINLGFS